MAVPQRPLEGGEPAVPAVVGRRLSGETTAIGAWPARAEPAYPGQGLCRPAVSVPADHERNCQLIKLVGTSSESWEDAAQTALDDADETLEGSTGPRSSHRRRMSRTDRLNRT
ncbi:dodecin domain-containing protein [Natrinema sp. H-ect4]|uniref:dodecin domain-containing protein n=1 Tax=Natrinema sp. H-ect4 TaxID=3242699 RepID=UPI0035A8C946